MQRYYTVQQLIAQLLEMCGENIAVSETWQNKWWKTHSFLVVFVQLSYNK